jgi:hypothetical protein
MCWGRRPDCGEAAGGTMATPNSGLGGHVKHSRVRT